MFYLSQQQVTRRLFLAPNKGNFASQRYQCFIDVRVATKSNRYREYHPDSDYLFSKNKHRREFCTIFKEDACILSMDNMAKIKLVLQQSLDITNCGDYVPQQICQLCRSRLPGAQLSVICFTWAVPLLMLISCILVEYLSFSWRKNEELFYYVGH